MDELNNTTMTETAENEGTAMTVEFVERKQSRKEKAVMFAAGAASGIAAFFGIKKLIENHRRLKKLKAERAAEQSTENAG